MKEKIQAVFSNLPVNARADFYSTYLSIQDAVSRGDYAVIDRIVKIVPNGGEDYSDDVTKAVQELYSIIQSESK